MVSVHSKEKLNAFRDGFKILKVIMKEYLKTFNETKIYGGKIVLKIQNKTNRINDRPDI